MASLKLSIHFYTHHGSKIYYTGISCDLYKNENLTTTWQPQHYIIPISGSLLYENLITTLQPQHHVVAINGSLLL